MKVAVRHPARAFLKLKNRSNGLARKGERECKSAERTEKRDEKKRARINALKRGSGENQSLIVAVPRYKHGCILNSFFRNRLNDLKIELLTPHLQTRARLSGVVNIVFCGTSFFGLNRNNHADGKFFIPLRVEINVSVNHAVYACAFDRLNLA